MTSKYRLCADGWGQSGGNVDSFSRDAWNDDGEFVVDPSDRGSSSAYFESQNWGQWTAHGELEDGRLILQHPNGYRNHFLVDIVELSDGENVRVARGFEWDVWEEACSVPDGVPDAFENVWSERVTQGQPSGFEELGEYGEVSQDVPSTGGCSNECEYAGDGSCDDGGPGAEYAVCVLGTDCGDCGTRETGRSGAGWGSASELKRLFV